METNIEPKLIQQTYFDFKKVVDKYFSSDVYSEGVFNSQDMSEVIEEFSTVCQKFARLTKDKENENPGNVTSSL